MQTGRSHHRWQQYAPVAIVLALGLVYYLNRLMNWLAYDDEGGYLYAAWRITQGELPYHDFLTPQLPAFLYPGALVLALSHNSALAARLSMMLLVLGATLITYLTARRVWGPRAALLGSILMVTQSETYWAARFFRPEAPMLFWAALGVFLFVRAYPERRTRGLALGGAALGLAMMSKLFGALPVLGIGLFLLAEWIAARDWRDTLRVGFAVALPFLAVVALIGGVLSLLAPEMLASVLGHHLRQGRGMPALQVIAKAAGLYWGFFRVQPVFVALGLAGAALSLRARDGRQARVIAWQLPTALAFLMLTRDLQARHLTYLIPALALLGGMALDRLWAAAALRFPRGRGLVAFAAPAALLALALWPQIAQNALVASWRDVTTAEWGAYIQARTAPDDVVVSDYPGLNFYAQRRSTRLAAGISEGAALSGQIMGSDIIAEIEASDASMVLFNIAYGGHQFVNLQDHPALKEYLLQHYVLSDRRPFDHRLIEVYSRQDYWPGTPLDANLGNRLRLTGVQWVTGEAAPGQELRLLTRWTALAAMDVDYGVTLRLMDERGHAWGLGHKLLTDYHDRSYWIEGLEYIDYQPTSQWPAGEASIATLELPVDPGTPPGEYSVVLRVHPQGAWDGLMLLDGQGAPTGYDLVVGRARVSPATLPADAARLPMDEAVSQDLAPGVRLLGYSRLPGAVRPGDTLGVSLSWLALQDAPGPYRVRLAVEGSAQLGGAQIVDLSNGDYPTTAWRNGEPLRGQYDLVIDAETPNGEYAVTATLVDAAGQPVGAPYPLGAIQVTGRERLYEVPPMQHSVGARLGGAVTLLGYDLASESLDAGGTLDLTLYWRAEARVGAAYKVFTHVIDGADHVWGQQDSEPVEGASPTTGWLPGEIIVDPYHVAVDAAAPEGDYAMEVGMYDAATVVRLPATDAEGAPLANDRILLSGLRVSR